MATSTSRLYSSVSYATARDTRDGAWQCVQRPEMHLYEYFLGSIVQTDCGGRLVWGRSSFLLFEGMDFHLHHWLQMQHAFGSDFEPIHAVARCVFF